MCFIIVLFSIVTVHKNLQVHKLYVYVAEGVTEGSRIGKRFWLDHFGQFGNCW